MSTPRLFASALLIACGLAAPAAASASGDRSPAGPVGWADHGGGLSTAFRGPHLVLDWATAAYGPSHLVQGPVHFRIFSRDGRFIAERQARRSAQGWIASLRVAGWPAGDYTVSIEAEAHGSSASLTLP